MMWSAPHREYSGITLVNFCLLKNGSVHLSRAFFQNFIIRHQQIITLFPYTTLFRSQRGRVRPARRRPAGADVPVVVARAHGGVRRADQRRSEEHTSELQSQSKLVCRLLLEKKNYD